MGKKKAGKEAGSKLLRALGRTKKEQMKVLYPKAKTKAYPKIKSKGPYTRGKVMGAGDLITRRATIGGTKFPAPTKKKGMSELVKTGILLGTGYGVAKLGSKYSANKKAQAKKGAADLIKKQKEQKEKNKRKKHHS